MLPLCNFKLLLAAIVHAGAHSKATKMKQNKM